MSLPEPRTDGGRAGLAALRAAPAEALVALDFDGTLAPIVSDPASSRLADGAADALRVLAGRVGLLAIVTGRSADVAVDLGGFESVPGIVVLGQYGAEQWQDGVLKAPDPAPGLAPMRAALPGVLDGTDPQVWIEDKTLGLVVHTRRSPDPDRELAALAPRVIALAEEHGLEASSGRAVVEVRSSGVDKGGAIRRLVAEHRPSAVLFGGDDLGDLPAYDAVEALRGEGTPGLTVCSASAEVPEVAARADVVVEGPAGMVGFLTDLADAIN